MERIRMIGGGTVTSCPFPVGSIYLSVTNANPSASFPGTEWESIGAGRVLQGADDAHAAGTTIEAGLPNITGVVGPIDDASKNNLSGACYNAGAVAYDATSNNSSGGGWKLGIDASKSNSIYGASETVQPPALAVYMWQRTA